MSAFLQDTHQNHAFAVAVFAALPPGSAQFASIVTVAEMEFGLKEVIANGAHQRQIAAVSQRVAIVRHRERLQNHWMRKAALKPPRDILFAKLRSLSEMPISAR